MAQGRNRKGAGDGPLAGERGTLRREAPVRVALGYPAPYAVGASSLGFQQIYRRLNEASGVSCGRFFLERNQGGGSR